MKITRTCTGLLLHNYVPKTCKNLEWKTSILNRNTHKLVPTTGFYDEKTHTFATYNMTNEQIRFMLSNSPYKTADIIAENPRLGRRMQPFTTNIKLTDVQQPVFDELIYNKKSETFVNLPTAIGKTIIAVQYVSFMATKCIILCYNSKVLDQWKSAFEEKTNIDPNRIEIIKESKYLMKVIDDKIDVNGTDIWLATPAMIHSFGENHGWDLLSKAFDRMGIGIKIIDEAHRNLGTTIRLNAWTNIAKTVYLSADFNQASYEMRKQFFEVFKFVPVIKLDDDTLKDLKHITAVVYKFNSHPDIKDILKVTNGGKRNRYHWDQYGYTKYALANGELSQRVVKILEQILKSDKETANGKPYKILILSNMIAAVDDIYSIINAMPTGRTVSRLHGDVPKEEASKATSADIIISTYQAFSIGVDITYPNIRHVISMCPVDSIAANQAAGRNRPIEGLKSFFWMLVDQGFDYCVSNSTKVLKYLSLSRIGEIKCIDEGAVTNELHAVEKNDV